MGSEMIVSERTIESPCELTQRNAHNFVFKIKEIESEIKICTLDEPPANAKSLLGVLGLQIRQGQLIRITSFNKDKTQAINDLQKTVKTLYQIGKN